MLNTGYWAPPSSLHFLTLIKQDVAGRPVGRSTPPRGISHGSVIQLRLTLSLCGQGNHPYGLLGNEGLNKPKQEAIGEKHPLNGLFELGETKIDVCFVLLTGLEH